MDAYGTDDGLEEWATATGATVPSGSIAAARLRASIYIDGMYGTRFSGTPTGGASQDREWPRTGATDMYGNALSSTDVPSRVETATYIAALQELASVGSLSVNVAPGAVKKKVSVSGAVSVEYATGADTPEAQQVVMADVERVLLPLLAPADLPGILVV